MKRMNFFAHAAVAQERCPSRAFALGAMLPDLVGMVGLSLPRGLSADVAEGTAHHVQADSAFHGAPIFTRLSAAASTELRHRGMEKGRARAVAHVGVEILIDGGLAENSSAVTHYKNALAHGRCLAPGWRWPSPRDAQRLADLCERLESRPLRDDSWEPERIAWRLERALSGRPRLALSGTDVWRARQWSTDYREQICALTPMLLWEVRRAL